MKLDYNWVSKDVLNHVVATLVRGGVTKKEATSFGDTVVKLNHFIHDDKTTPEPYKYPEEHVNEYTPMEMVYYLDYIDTVFYDCGAENAPFFAKYEKAFLKFSLKYAQWALTGTQEYSDFIKQVEEH